MRLSQQTRIAISIGTMLTVLAGAADAAAIVADGGTTTLVSTATGGHQTVNIAPAIGGVSNNTYSSFNVTPAGADLNNVGTNARTIVNQVTSTNPSLIQGAISVLGSRANVILANPNGITIDGGSFINAGHVVLSTGQVSFNDLTPAPGVTQRNVVLTTDQGRITIGPGGLTGTLINLDLIAKQLAINGPVTNSFTSSTSGIRAIVGDSTNTYDTSYSPSDNNHDWLASTRSPGSSSSALAVDITPLGSLTAGRIELIVNDKGAGVRSFGKLYASAGDAVILANGDVSVSDGSIVAEHDVQVTTTGAVSLTDAQAEAANNLALSAKGLAISDNATGPSLVSANAGSVNLSSTGDISNAGSVIQAGSVASNGTATGGDVSLTASGNITNLSTPANLGIIFSANGKTTLSAQGGITNDNARILSNGALTLTAQCDVQNIIDHTRGTNGGAPLAYSNTGGSFIFFTHTSSGFAVDYGTVSQPTQLAYIASTGGPVSIAGQNVTNSGGIIQSSNASVSIAAQNAFTNAAVFTGQASYAHSCWIFCHSNAASNVTPYGGTIQSSTDISITAGKTASNIGGNVFAQGNITVAAPTTYATGVSGYSAINQDRGFKVFFGSTWAQIIATDVGGGFTADGSVSLTGDAIIDGGYITGAKGVSATGGITSLRSPATTPVQIGQHLGLTTWVGF